MNTQNQDRIEMQKNIDVSKSYQPNGPVKADIPVAKKLEHIEFRVTRNQSLIALGELIEDLKGAKEAFSEFKSKLSPDIEEARRDWYRKKPEQTGRASVYENWQNADPELKDLPAVRAAEIRVQNLKAQLADAEGELNKLRLDGTPRQKYTKSLVSAWTAINALAGELRNASFMDILYTLYKTEDLTLIPAQAAENAKIHPNVYRWQRFQVARILDPLRTEFGDAELSTGHARLAREVEKLIELIKEA